MSSYGLSLGCEPCGYAELRPELWHALVLTSAACATPLLLSQLVPAGTQSVGEYATALLQALLIHAGCTVKQLGVAPLSLQLL